MMSSQIYILPPFEVVFSVLAISFMPTLYCIRHYRYVCYAHLFTLILCKLHVTISPCLTLSTPDHPSTYIPTLL